MGADFSLSTSSSDSILTVNPQNVLVGDYELTFHISLTNYPKVFSTITTSVTITACVVTSVKVVQAPSKFDLASQSYQLMSPTDWTYPLTTLQSPDCGYPSSGWMVAQGPIISGNSPDEFLTINDSGVFTVGVTAGSSYERAGEYTVLISRVSVNGITYDQTSLLSPKEFILTVSCSDLCASTTLTASTIT
jgi:hypothetical protein